MTPTCRSTRSGRWHRVVAAVGGEVVVVFVRHIPVMTEATAAEAGEAIVMIENSLDELEKTGESEAAACSIPSDSSGPTW